MRKRRKNFDYSKPSWIVERNKSGRKAANLIYPCSDLPDTPENQERAREALVQARENLRTVKPPHANWWGRDLMYLEGLEKIFIALERQNYIEACDETCEYLAMYWTEETHDGLILLLEKAKKAA